MALEALTRYKNEIASSYDDFFLKSQHHELTSRHKEVTNQHKDLTGRHNYLTCDGRNMPPNLLLKFVVLFINFLL